MTENSGSNKFVRGVLVATLLTCLSTSASVAQEPPLLPKTVTLNSIEWGAPGGGNGYPVGVRSAQQGIDARTGGITYYALFPSGSHFDLHWHSHDEFVVVVQGTVTIELDGQTQTLGVGSYVVIPGTMQHSWDVPIASGEDAIILVRRGGPADFNFVQ